MEKFWDDLVAGKLPIAPAYIKGGGTSPMSGDVIIKANKTKAKRIATQLRKILNPNLVYLDSLIADADPPQVSVLVTHDGEATVSIVQDLSMFDLFWKYSSAPSIWIQVPLSYAEVQQISAALPGARLSTFIWRFGLRGQRSIYLSRSKDDIRIRTTIPEDHPMTIDWAEGILAAHGI